MSYWRDIIDWVGGYPFEVAAPDEVFDFYRARNFELIRLVCKGAGSGCVEYVFELNPS
jgi:2-polyprenyl-6-hydroxyphenyl methylase/3-demethylubiquinone-9 3-methyltransferase